MFAITIEMWIGLNNPLKCYDDQRFMDEKNKNQNNLYEKENDFNK